MSVFEFSGRFQSSSPSLNLSGVRFTIIEQRLGSLHFLSARSIADCSRCERFEVGTDCARAK